MSPTSFRSFLHRLFEIAQRRRRRPAPALWAVGLLAAAAAASAGGEPLVTDRPDFTESAVTVTRGRTQLETGYTFSRDGDDEEHALGELLVRIGWTEMMEIRVGLGSHLWQEGPGADASGLEDASIGVKIRLSDPLPPGSRQPQVAVLFSTTLDNGSAEVGASAGFQPRATLALGWELSERTALGSNVGYSRVKEEGDDFGELAGSLSLGRALGDRLGGYVEYYGFARQGGRGDDHFLNGGLTWALSEDSQLDLRAGAGLNDQAADYFVGAGAAWRW